MKSYEKTIIPLIESSYNDFTATEKNIANFFINNGDGLKDLSAKNVAKHIFVSEASLSRFAKKCGFKGYREFLFIYQNSSSTKEKEINDLTKSVLNTYQELLNKTFALVDENQMNRISKMLVEANKVYIYGIVSSGMAAQEFKIRFMRLGMNVESITDPHIMKMNSALVKSKNLVIGITVSGKTKEILSALKIAKEHNATTLLISSSNSDKFKEYCDEILLIATTQNLDAGNIISPQFPILIILDIFYAYFLNTDYYNKLAVHTDTLSALWQEI